MAGGGGGGGAPLGGLACGIGYIERVEVFFFIFFSFFWTVSVLIFFWGEGGVGGAMVFCVCCLSFC